MNHLIFIILVYTRQEQEQEKQVPSEPAITEEKPDEEGELSLFKNTKSKGRFGGDSSSTMDPKPSLITASKATQCNSLIWLSK